MSSVQAIVLFVGLITVVWAIAYGYNYGFVGSRRQSRTRMPRHFDDTQ
jgi:hypothetical protein